MPTPVPPSQQVVSALVVQQCLRLAESRGIAPEQFLRAAGIRREQLSQDQLQLPWLPVQRQLRLVLERIDDPLLGLHTAPLINLATLGVLGYVLQTSTTLQNLVDTVVRFSPLLTNAGCAWQRADGDRLLLGWDSYIEDELVSRHATDCVIGRWASLTLTLMRKQATFPLLAVRLQHGPPRHAAQRREYEDFFRCPVQFQQPESGLLLAPAALGQILTLADPALHRLLEEHAHRMLNRRQGHPVALLDQVRAALREQLSRQHAPTREQVAAELGMSGRTLHRRLQEAGTSFRALLDDIRYDFAQDYLGASTLTMDAISQQLGFQESQSFIRWFRQLAGTTPGEFRQQRLKAGPAPGST
jgi:AraC-like DNA-binding protein